MYTTESAHLYTSNQSVASDVNQLSAINTLHGNWADRIFHQQLLYYSSAQQQLQINSSLRSFC